MDKLIYRCYACLKKRSLLPLNDVDIDNMSYLSKLLNCIPNLIQNNQMYICELCISDLKVAYNFITLVLQSQNTWKEINENLDKTNSKPEYTDIETQTIHDMSLEFQAICNEIKDEEERELTGALELKLEDKIQEPDYIFESDLAHEDNSSDEEADGLTCTHCKYECETINELCSHSCSDKDTFEKVTVDSLTCSVCKYKYETIEDFNLHKCRSENKYKPPKKFKMTKKISRLPKNSEAKYDCPYCDKSYKQAAHLKEHLPSHTGEKPYSCSICDKQFQRSSSQKRHMKTHNLLPGQKTKKTPYLCTICGKSFPYSNGAQRHMRIHTGERKFSCDICGKKFSQSTHLHVHMRVHTGEKPYICDSCGEAFSLRATLSKHMKLHLEDSHRTKRESKKQANHLNPIKPKIYFESNNPMDPDGTDYKGYVHMLYMPPNGLM